MYSADKTIKGRTNIRVRYAETDTMGVLHHASYIIYFEVGRTELIREFGFSYDAMEKNGVMLPVYKVEANYLKPAYYDELLTLETELAEIKGVRIKFTYKLLNDREELLADGAVTLIFTDTKTFKPVRPPKWFLEVF